MPNGSARSPQCALQVIECASPSASFPSSMVNVQSGLPLFCYAHSTLGAAVPSTSSARMPSGIST
jgi:hypothetical protein